MKIKIPYGEKIPVLLSKNEIGIIRDHTFYPESEKLIGVISRNKIKVMLSLDDIDDLMGYVAAEANHTDDKKLQNTLDKIFSRLDDYLSKYDDPE